MAALRNLVWHTGMVDYIDGLCRLMDILRSVVNSRDIGYKVGQYLVLLPVVVVREMVRQVSLDKVSVLFSV